jgi:hypothetical protein|tara:strand:- start:5670 stop:5981 length:312 start_codon:yes stop_codon:yes gene_type:complete
MDLREVIDDMDFRYKKTLRINFNEIVGLGSCYGSINEINNKDRIWYEDYSGIMLQKYLDMKDEVEEEILKSIVGEDIEFDWRDDMELEIHGVDSVKGYFKEYF